MASRELIVGEYGMDFIIGVSFDMSGNTSLQMTFLKPDKTTLQVAATLGTIQITTSEGIFEANEWAFYTFVDGDLDQVGNEAKGNPWTSVLDYFTATEKFTSSGDNFDVVERADAC